MIFCPVCKNETTHIKLLDSRFIEGELEKFYHEKIPMVNLVDYNLYRCNQCTLEFFDPMQAGSKKFYDWIIHQPNYYPTYRWEWGVAIDDIYKKSLSNNKNKLLEIGCGYGDFLKFVKRNDTINVIGLDTSKSAISVCEARDLPAHCLSIEEYLLQMNQDTKFDFICSFHCLEHVEDPLEFISSMKNILNAKGVIYLSTPYSPMFYESQWYDPLNHPPHHMTRWNKKSYEALAKVLGFKITFFTHQPSSRIMRTLVSLDIKYYGFKIFHSRKQMWLNAIKKYKDFLIEYKKQGCRDIINGFPAPDVILVKLELV